MHDVTLVIGDLREGGAQRVASTLAGAWADAGHRVAVITFADGDGDVYPLDRRASRIVIGHRSPSTNPISALCANIRRIVALRRAIREGGAPVVISFVGTTNILVILATLGLRIRVVISERNDPARQSLGPAWDRLRRLVYRHADLVTANSRNAIDTLAAYVPRNRLRLVPNPVNRPPVQSTVKQRDAVILNVGRLTIQKAQDVLIRAFGRVAAETPNWRLVIAGTGEREHELRTLARSLGIADRVDFPGWVDPWTLFPKAAIFALPSRFEGTPNALLEAMSAGVPPIVSDTSGGALEFVENGETGLVVRAIEDELADALLYLIHDESERNRLGAAAQERVRSSDLTIVLGIWSAVIALPPPRALPRCPAG
jgi:GalNAc-alpha-(1->4)-GalNAc-alpha-(1->3)-diNAcBac-PP-undecaprenol alpha-1,4-N-acetyl-D-galactosaminyltransferase